MITFFTHSTQAVSPPWVDFRFDLTTLRDPIGQLALTSKAKDGRDLEVTKWMALDDKVQAVVDTIILLVATSRTGPMAKPSVSIGLQDFHGKWISPAVAKLAKARIEVLFPETPITITYSELSRD